MGGKDDYLRWVLEQLAGAGGVSFRRMFGVFGLYRNEVFFGIISGDTLFFKVSDTNRADYETRGMARFRPYRNKPLLSMSYYEVPADVLEDADECVRWAMQAVAAGAVKKKSSKRRRGA